MEQKVKLTRYRRLKTELTFEPYLRCDCSRYDLANYVQWRGGVAKLRIETGRWERLAREERVCDCGCGEVGDERHVMMECDRWKVMRQEMEEERGDGELNGEAMVDWALAGMSERGGGRGESQMTRVIETLGRGMRTRDKEHNMRKRERKGKEDIRKEKNDSKGNDQGKTQGLEDKRNIKGGRAFVWRMRVKGP